jgi:dephospho-CoA kinase
MKIVAFAGMPCSGKSEAVRIAQDKGIPFIRMGDLVWEETKKHDLQLTNENVGFIATTMRKEHGKDIWAKRTLERIHQLKPTDLIVIDGVRNKEEIVLFKEKLGDDFVVVAIVASEPLRKQRAFSRKRSDDSSKPNAFEKRDKRELTWGLGNVIDNADIIIYNEGTLDELYGKVEAVFDNLQKR